jgi:hypothetical protein
MLSGVSNNLIGTEYIFNILKNCTKMYTNEYCNHDFLKLKSFKQLLPILTNRGAPQLACSDRSECLNLSGMPRIINDAHYGSTLLHISKTSETGSVGSNIVFNFWNPG